MKNKTPQQKLRDTEPPQLGKDLQYKEDNTKMELPGCTYLIPLRVESPDRMRNINASDLYSSSGKENGCTTFVGNSNGNFFDFKPLLKPLLFKNRFCFK